MKKIIAFSLSVFLFVLAFVGIGFSVQAKTVSAENDLSIAVIKENGEKFSICITGEASKNVTPDIATIYASIETLNMEMQKSKDENFAAFDAVVKALMDAGVEKEDIIFEGFSSYPNYDYSSGKTLTGYRSTTSFSVSLKDTKDIASIVDIMTANGVTNIRHINYEVSNMEEIYQDVLMDALENAKQKAQKFTQRDDVKIISVREESVYSCTSLYRDYGEAMQNDATIGQLEVRARVTVCFE